MDVGELRELSDVELVEQHDELKEDLFNLRFQMATGQLDNPQLLKQTRRDIARVLTVLRERELEAEHDDAEHDEDEYDDEYVDDATEYDEDEYDDADATAEQEATA